LGYWLDFLATSALVSDYFTRISFAEIFLSIYAIIKVSLSAGFYY